MCQPSPVGDGETRWNRQKNGAEPDLVDFHIIEIEHKFFSKNV